MNLRGGIVVFHCRGRRTVEVLQPEVEPIALLLDLHGFLGELSLGGLGSAPRQHDCLEMLVTQGPAAGHLQRQSPIRLPLADETKGGVIPRVLPGITAARAVHKHVAGIRGLKEAERMPGSILEIQGQQATLQTGGRSGLLQVNGKLGADVLTGHVQVL